MSNAPRVTQEDVDGLITSVVYVVLPDGRTTIALGTLKNGYTVRGESSCVSAANFDEKLGEQYSLADLKNKVWPLAGLLLAERLHQEKLSQGADWIDRLHAEWKELVDRLEKLKAMLANPHPAIQETDLKILDEQARIMGMYEEILRMRLDRARQG